MFFRWRHSRNVGRGMATINGLQQRTLEELAEAAYGALYDIDV
jgi:hypothetical protein